MAIQKPTMLDAARIASELNRMTGTAINAVYRDRSGQSLFIEFINNDMILKFSTSKKSAHIGFVNTLPESNQEIFKSITKAKIVSSEQINFDRLVGLKLDKQDRLGRSKIFKILFELIPNRGDTILVDDTNKIIESLKNNSRKK